MKKLLLLSLLFSFVACHPRQDKKPAPLPGPQASDTISFAPPKNIILMIGDGMGLTQITAGMYVNGNKLHLEQFSYIGLQKTYASDDLVTDSAASATAFASGVKTYNGAIGLDAGKKPVKTILEQAEEAGMATGLVVTSSITHATPACFYSHQQNRSMMEAIAADMLGAGVDFFVGGGKKYFDQRKDGVDLIAQLGAKGYVITDITRNSIADFPIDPDKKFGYFTADEEPKALSQGRDYFVSACERAIGYLARQDGKGFFLMIEGSQIDWGGHANDSGYIVSEMIEFDKTIGAALDFAKEDGETLIIVTADHETGGYSINPGSKMDSIVPAFTTKAHTAALIPVFAWGPGAELFGGMYENTAIYEKMCRALGFVKPGK